MANPIGRPSKFTDEVKAKLLIAIRKGAPYELACNYARVSYSKFREFVIEGEKGENKDYVDFLDALKEAEGQTSLIWLDKIDKAMNDGAWQAAAWKLERRHNKYFSSQTGLIEMNDRLDKIEKADHIAMKNKDGDKDK